MPDEAKVVTAKQKQRDASKRATLDLMKNKPRATSEFSIFIKDEDGETQELTLKFQAIGARNYDKLVAKHPPKPEQRADGASFNMDTFAPALIAAVSVEPEISVGSGSGWASSSAISWATAASTPPSRPARTSA